MMTGGVLGSDVVIFDSSPKYFLRPHSTAWGYFLLWLGINMQINKVKLTLDRPKYAQRKAGLGLSTGSFCLENKLGCLGPLTWNYVR